MSQNPQQPRRSLWDWTNHQVIGGWIVAATVAAVAAVVGYIFATKPAAADYTVTPSPTYEGVHDSAVVVADFDVFFDKHGENQFGEAFEMLPAKKVRWEIMADGDRVKSFNVSYDRYGLIQTDLMLCVKDGQVTDSFAGKSLKVSKIERVDGKDEYSRVHFRIYRVE